MLRACGSQGVHESSWKTRAGAETATLR